MSGEGHCECLSASMQIDSRHFANTSEFLHERIKIDRVRDAVWNRISSFPALLGLCLQYHEFPWAIANPSSRVRIARKVGGAGHVSG
jgi:hypothetical protein